VQKCDGSLLDSPVKAARREGCFPGLFYSFKRPSEQSLAKPALIVGVNGDGQIRYKMVIEALYPVKQWIRDDVGAAVATN